MKQDDIIKIIDQLAKEIADGKEQWRMFYFKKVTQALVDGKMFYTIRCHKDVSRWIREQPGEDTDWYQYIDTNWHIDFNMFDVSEEFYIMLKLRWGHEQVRS